MERRINGMPSIAEVLSSPAKVRTVIVSLLAVNEQARRNSDSSSEKKLNPLEIRRRELQDLLTMMRGQEKSVPEAVHHCLERILSEEVTASNS